MTHVEAEDCFDRHILARFPKFKPTAMQRADFVSVFIRYDNPAVAGAVYKYCTEYPVFDIPKLNIICTILKASGGGIKPQHAAIVLHFEITKDFGLSGHRFYGLPNANVEKTKRKAEYVRKKHEEIYGGEWISIIGQEDVLPDDGLRGIEARRRAEENILNGSDCPGKRFLQKLRGSDKSLVAALAEAMPCVESLPVGQ